MTTTVAPELLGRRAAMNRGVGLYFTGKPCNRGHIAERRVVNYVCLGCEKVNGQNARATHPERRQGYAKKRRAEYVAVVRARRRELVAWRALRLAELRDRALAEMGRQLVAEVQRQIAILEIARALSLVVKPTGRARKIGVALFAEENRNG